MKNKKNGLSVGLILAGSLMISNYSFAGIGNKFNEFVGNDSSNLSSLYIILGVVVVGLLGKLLQNYLTRQEEKTSRIGKISQHSHHRHHRHHRAVVKKTS